MDECQVVVSEIAGADRIREYLSADAHFAGICGVDPGQDLDQCRFPRAILANKRVNFTGRDSQVDVA